jgi:hypothetical protein
MGQLVLLVVAAAWAAVLLPPLLRSRLENRPNSSVTDFRRQLNRLQSSVPQRAGGSMRYSMARPLAPSPLQRPAAGGRPGTPHARRNAAANRHAAPTRGRSSGPAGLHEGSMRPRTHAEVQPRAHRQAYVSRVGAPDAIRRRRSNVLFMLVLAAASTLFLAATTEEPAMLYFFALAFLALAGYIYLLAQLRQREQYQWPDTWPRA